MSGQTADNPKAHEASAPADPLVYVELAPGLLPYDLRWEARLLLLKNRPFALARAPVDAHLHPDVVERFSLDASLLPYRTDVLEALRAHKRAGRRLVLVSDLPREVADAVAQHLDLFDEVVATKDAI